MMKTVSNDEIHSIVHFKHVDQLNNQIEMKISPISPTQIIKVSSIPIFHQFSSFFEKEITLLRIEIQTISQSHFHFLSHDQNQTI